MVVVTVVEKGPTREPVVQSSVPVTGVSSGPRASGVAQFWNVPASMSAWVIAYSPVIDESDAPGTNSASGLPDRTTSATVSVMSTSYSVTLPVFVTVNV